MKFSKQLNKILLYKNKVHLTLVIVKLSLSSNLEAVVE